MRIAQGFLADDGTFFENMHLAAKHDAELQIRAYCVSHTRPIDAEVFLHHIEALADPIMEYVNACKDYEAETVKDANSPGPREHSTNTGGYAIPAAVFEQSPDGYEPMPDVGSGTQSEDLYEHGEGDGLGSWGGDAPSVRRSANMATHTRPEAPAPRPHRGSKDIR